MAVYYYGSRIMPGTKSWESLRYLLNMDLEGKRRKITYISGSMTSSLAAKKVKEESKSYRNGASKNLVQLGIDMSEFILLWKNGNKEEMAQQILDSDLVYLLGGNPLEQIKYLKENELDKVLKVYNGIVVGVSCGSMTMSSNVIVPPCGDKYHETSIKKGLGLTELNAFPHLDYEVGKEKIETKDGYIYLQDLIAISKQYQILGLPNETIIRCSNEGVHVMGDTPHILSNGEVNEVPSILENMDGVKIKKLVFPSK